MFLGQHGHVKVKTAELKAHLSQYLKGVRDSGEPLEVCVREETVAYLVSARSDMKAKIQAARKLADLQDRLRGSGISLGAAPLVSSALPEICPVAAGDGREDISTVSEVRASKGW
jgi:prevent-host-death family protein